MDPYPGISFQVRGNCYSMARKGRQNKKKVWRNVITVKIKTKHNLGTKKSTTKVTKT